MKLAFCLFNYFPFGGLQRDFFHIAEVCRNRGHEIHVFTMKWEGEMPRDFAISLISAGGLTNHTRCRNFSKKVCDCLKKGGFDLAVGFNKMHCLDVYYAADPCYKARMQERKSILYRTGPRYRTYAALEKAVFERSSHTHILLIAPPEKAKFKAQYGTPDERFHSLPPGITGDRRLSDNAEEIRTTVRNECGVAGDEFMLLMVGSGFATKGLDRSLEAIAALPEKVRYKTKLFVIGKGKTTSFEKKAQTLTIADRLIFLGGRSDVPRFMVGADLLLHPARSENTGTVLIEAMASGLPVLATDICGYAFHVRDAGAGLLAPSPFRQQELNELLHRMITSPERAIWKRKGIEYVERNDFFSMPEKAADMIESIAASKAAKP
jgi:UDP-glucose:(heptosyl)LPS alpha-1,3-glucosyltransferase